MTYPMKKKDTTPIAQAKKEARLAAERSREHLRDLRKHFGTRPWDDPKLTPRQQMEAFAAVKDDPEFWKMSTLLEGRKLQLSDGLVPRSIIEDAAKMNAKYQEAVARGETFEVPEPMGEPVEEEVI